MPVGPAAGAEAPFILTLDVGTSSVRTLLFDRKGWAVEGIESRRPYSVRATPDGGAEIDAEELLGLVEEAIDEGLDRARSAGLDRRIGGVASCTFWHSVLGVGIDGKPLTPIYSWADTRAAGPAGDLRRRLVERDVHARTGCVLHACYLPAKLLWLSRIDPDRFRRAVRWMSFGEYLFLKLFGTPSVGVSMASASGLLDVHRLEWDREVQEAVGLRSDQLSPLSEAPRQGLRSPYDSRWPILAGVPWFPPAGDGACSNLGSGGISPERVCVMVGTSGAMRVVLEAPGVTPPWGLFCYRADRRRYVIGGALSGGGNFIAWLSDTLGIGGRTADLEAAVGALEPDGHGLTVLPFIAGERSPGWVAEARVTVSGLNLHTRPIDILRAGMESVALRFAILYDLIREAVPQTREVVATGGALLASPAWMQILADVLGCPLAASAEPEASSRGAALLALESLGILRLEEAPAGTGRLFEPDSRRHERYRAALDRQVRLYDAIVARGLGESASKTLQ